jgi:hypothetical protein
MVVSFTCKLESNKEERRDYCGSMNIQVRLLHLQSLPFVRERERTRE